MNSSTNPSPEEKRYHLALALAPSIGPTLFKAIVAYAGSPLAFFTQAPKQVKKIPRIGKKLELLRKQQGDLLRKADALLHEQQQEGYQVLTSVDAQFPQRLLHLSDGPVVLFYQGTGELNMERSIGIVGTRSATAYGKKMTIKILEELCPYRPTILSGLAFGIDIEAHKAALQLGLPTLAVLGSPLNRIYPAAHAPLAQQLQQAQGGLLSEYAPGTKLLPGNFPARNRIIAGLSDALIVVEAAKKGGALITADLAFGYNKEVFAVPGNLQSPFSEGCNLLIKQMKASIYTRASDVADALNWTKPGEQKIKKAVLDFSSKEDVERKILHFLQEQGEAGIDHIALATQLEMSTVSSKLLSLEFEGLVKPLPGKKFKLMILR
jgi:DNA processing protein